MIKALKDKRGVGYIFPCVVTIVIAMILSVVLFYAECMTIIQTTKDDTERVLESFVMKNSIEIYNSIKQGHDFTEKIDGNIYVSDTSSELSLDISENMLYNTDNQGTTVYSMTVPKVSYTIDKALKLKANYTVIIPVTFAGNKIYDLEIPLEITKNLILK